MKYIFLLRPTVMFWIRVEFKMQFQAKMMSTQLYALQIMGKQNVLQFEFV